MTLAAKTFAGAGGPLEVEGGRAAALRGRAAAVSRGAGGICPLVLSEALSEAVGRGVELCGSKKMAERPLQHVTRTCLSRVFGSQSGA